MSVETEGQHREEFLLTDFGSISREKGVLASGQDVIDGTVVKDNGSGKLVVITGTVDSAGNADEDIKGVIIGNWNVTADTPVAYIARLAEVKSANLVIPGSNDSAVLENLAAKNIIAR